MSATEKAIHKRRKKERKRRKKKKFKSSDESSSDGGKKKDDSDSSDDDRQRRKKPLVPQLANLAPRIMKTRKERRESESSCLQSDMSECSNFAQK